MIFLTQWTLIWAPIGKGIHSKRVCDRPLINLVFSRQKNKTVKYYTGPSQIATLPTPPMITRTSARTTNHPLPTPNGQDVGWTPATITFFSLFLLSALIAFALSAREILRRRRERADDSLPLVRYARQVDDTNV